MELKINEVARLTKVTVRTLHYYDEIGLLKPSRITKSGYRCYDEAALSRLQQILFFKELEFSLKEIKEIMVNPEFDKTAALYKQKQLLLQKKERLEKIISLAEDAIRGEENMNFEAFDRKELEKSREEYAREVTRRWGSTDAYRQSQKKAGGYNNMQWNMLEGESQKLLKAFATKRSMRPESQEVQELVQKWQQFITTHFYECTKEILSCLGQMYIADERFKQNIDQNGEEAAAFMSEAIAVYCNR